jgi:predicted flap endonuclease-1-like 5' DNA nuclease
MSYILAQILICLLIAGVIGAIIGWIMRGGCSCEEELLAKDLELSEKLALTNANWEEKLQTQKREFDVEKQSLNASLLSSKSDAKRAMSNLESEWEGKIQGIKGDYDAKISGLDIEKQSLQENLNKEKTYAQNVEKKLVAAAENMDECYDIQEVEGIGPSYGKQLRAMGVETTCNLVEAFYKKDDNIEKAANAMKIDPETIKAWTSMADLMKIPGVGGQYAELMQIVGISSRADLANADDTSLYDEMVSFNKKSPIVPSVPTLQTLKGWIDLV